MFLIEALVSEVQGKPFEKYMHDKYNQRRQVKKEMKNHAKDSPDYASLDAL